MTPTRCELVIAGFALVALLLSQWAISTAIHATSYNWGDGKMVQALVATAYEFGGLFQVTNISPVQGIGSQMMPKNAWANPAFWPFAFVDRQLATDVSALVALACLVVACYTMARCFDVPIVPSAVAAQLCILLFAPLVQVILLYMSNFILTPADAVVYAPHMMALGLLARLEPRSPAMLLGTGGIFALLLYSICCDPLWSMVSGISWLVPFAVVTLAPLERKAILVRCAALGACVALLYLTGVGEYLYTVSHYTARLQFPDVFDRPRSPLLVSAVFRAPAMKYIYLACLAGWLLGLFLLRGRPKALVLACVITAAAYLGYCLAYLLLETSWAAPLPFYVEQCLFPLFVTAAVAGYWGALSAAVSLERRVVAAVSRSVRGAAERSTAWRTGIVSMLSPLAGGSDVREQALARALALFAALASGALFPAAIAEFAVNRSQHLADRFVEAWADEPELVRFFAERIGLSVGQPFRGSVSFPPGGHDTGLSMAALWAHGIPTGNEYSQMVSPQAVYFVHVLLKKDANHLAYELNRFNPWPGSSADSLWKMLQALGSRFYVLSGRHEYSDMHYPLTVLPRRPPWETGFWYVYELPRPNVGDYSPTEVAIAGSGHDVMTALAAPEFDFSRQAVLAAPIREHLVPARDMRLAYVRGGLHVSGRSDGTSLVVLPQQFSNCLRARDGRVRLVRANLMLTGVVFSGNVDTDILFDYGLFSPSCRRADLEDMKRLGIKVAKPPIAATGQPEKADLQRAVTWLHEIASAVK